MCDTIPYYTILYDTILYDTIPYYTILYYTILYYRLHPEDPGDFPWEDFFQGRRRRFQLIMQVKFKARGKRLHTRNQHLGNHHGCSMAFCEGLSVVCSS